jgi:YVTN family beta-propeller protein
VIDTQTSQVIGPPIEVGQDPQGIAITPDGRFAYVTSQGDGAVSVIDTQTRQVVGEPIKVGTTPKGISITPDGRFAYVANFNSKSVSVIDLATRFVGPPITVPEKPSAIAVAPGGSVAYVASEGLNLVSTIELQANQPFGAGIPVGGRPIDLAITPDGKTGYVSNFESKNVSVISTQANQPVATISAGVSPAAIAVAPDQAPQASFAVPDGRPGVSMPFNASGSTDAEGSIARYEWSFGDGTTLTSGGAEPRHTYKRPGDYKVTLTLTDEEGCSTAFVFTGQTVSCNGSPVATQTQAVQVAYPAVRIRCSARAGHRGCRVKLQAVSGRHGGKVESAVAKANLKAGRRATVALKTKPAFAPKLAGAHKILVRERLTMRGATRTRFARLKVVR